MKAVILGSAAGGGLPQWNCQCANCQSVRAGDGSLEPRSQSSLAVSQSGENWILINASPDVRTQLNRLGELHPPDGPRGTRLYAVLLTDAEIDHSLGLMVLREGAGLDLHTTPAVREALTRDFRLLTVLESFCDLNWHPLPTGSRAREGLDRAGLRFEAFELSGHPPGYVESPRDEGYTVGLEIHDPSTDGTLCYVPALNVLTDSLKDRFARADTLLLDGTFWSDDELETVAGVPKTAADTGHLPIGGPGGSMNQLEDPGPVRKIYVHINNTNPVLRPDSDPRRRVEEAGFEVAHDGMTLIL